MSSSAAEAAYEGLLILLQDSFISACCEVAICACIVYEYLITFGKEAELVWGRKLTGPNLLFFVNRYSLLSWALVNILGLFPWDTPTRQVCEAILLLKFITQVLLYCLWAVFSGLRVFAVSGRHWPLALLTVALGLVPVALNIYSLTKTSYSSVAPVPVLGHVCENTSYLTSDWGILVAIASTIASDALVLSVTWWNTYQIKRDAAHANVNATVVTLLLRDGTIYFLFLLILNVIAILLDTRTAYVYVLYFISPISSILISRFLLNLRNIYYSSSVHRYNTDGTPFSAPYSTAATTTTMPAMRFAYNGNASTDAYVGQMGAPLTHGPIVLTAGGDKRPHGQPGAPAKWEQQERSVDDGHMDDALVWRVSSNPLAVGVVLPDDQIELVCMEDA